ncbi:MAG: Ppx/GppA family phosphatase [Neisseriaceae bacterium]|nr:Ppx/GppA family phosphatase [Neisseriaceae bacterium]
MSQDIIASVDLGSNSFRLQICQNQNGHLHVIDSIKEMVRLAAGLDENKNLSKEARIRALDCLSRFGERLRNIPYEQVRVVATNTFRIMKNVQPFLQQAEDALGFPIEIIAGREEARLIYTGVVHTVPFDGKRALVVDIGGGSTEFIIGSDLQPDITESLNLGCVSYSIRFFKDNKVTKSNFRNAVNTARAEIQRISGILKEKSWDIAIGTSGTARCLRDINTYLENNNKDISIDTLNFLSNKLIRAGNAHKLNLEGLRLDRKDSFAGGLAVMTAIFVELDIKQMSVTDAALRDGVFYDLIGRRLNGDMRNTTIATFQNRYHVDIAQALRVENLALQFLNALSIQVSQERQRWISLVSWAARVHEIGLSIAHTAYHKHSAYILDQADMPGFSRTEQHILSILVLSHRGNIKKIYDVIDNHNIITAILSLRLSALLNRARTDINLPDNTLLQLDVEHKKFTLSIQKQWLVDNPLTMHTLKLEADMWSKIDYNFMINAIK